MPVAFVTEGDFHSLGQHICIRKRQSAVKIIIVQADKEMSGICLFQNTLSFNRLLATAIGFKGDLFANILVQILSDYRQGILVCQQHHPTQFVNKILNIAWGKSNWKD